jgi:hypothetical protein
VLDDTLFFGVAVEADDRAQPTGDGGAGLAAIFEVTSEALDVDATDIEELVVVLPAPGGELAQIQLVRVAGEASVAGQEAEQRHPLDVGQHQLVARDSGSGTGHGQEPPCVVDGDPDHNAPKAPAGGQRNVRPPRQAE